MEKLNAAQRDGRAVHAWCHLYKLIAFVSSPINMTTGQHKIRNHFQKYCFYITVHILFTLVG